MAQDEKPTRGPSPTVYALAQVVVLTYDIKYHKGDSDPDLTVLNSELFSCTEEYRRAAIAILTKESYTSIMARNSTEQRVYRVKWHDEHGLVPILVSCKPINLSWIRPPKPKKR